MSEKENFNEVTLLDMIKAVAKKWKMLLCITLAALLLCGGVGAVVSKMGNQDFGAEIEFYVTSEKANKYILSLVQSDKFAEELLMDANGLPAEYKDTKEYKQALEMKQAIDALEEDLKILEEELLYQPRKVTEAQKLANDAQTEYNEVVNHLTIMYASSYADKNKISKAEEELVVATKKRDELKKAYNEASTTHENMKEDVSRKTLEIQSIKEDFFDIKEGLLSKFRNQPKNAGMISKVKNSVTYEYAEDQDIESQAVLYVSIAVHKDEKTAQMLIEKLPEKMSDFINDNINQEINCKYMSAQSAVAQLEENPLVSTVLKFGGIGAALVLFVSCCGVVVVFLFKVDKKPQVAEEKE